MAIKRASDYTFFENVFDVVRQIPRGRVTSYGMIASYLGSKQTSRMVGWAMNRAHDLHPPVPAHRVVNRNGLLTGKHHFSPPESMQLSLEAEGVNVIDDQIIDFKNHVWNPCEELL